MSEQTTPSVLGTNSSPEKVWVGNVVTWPNEVLSREAEPIKEFNYDIIRLAEGMTALMIDHNGLGLAAPQVNVSIRMFVMRVGMPGHRIKRYVFCNPVVVASGPEEADIEGCLSMPGVRGQVFRKSKVHMKYEDQLGDPGEIFFEGLDRKSVV